MEQNKFAKSPAFVYSPKRKTATAQKTKNLFPPYKFGRQFCYSTKIYADTLSSRKLCRAHILITAPKTYAGDIKAFANSRSLRETYFHFANA